MPEQESAKTRAQTFYDCGKEWAENNSTTPIRPNDFDYHADWQNFLAGVRAAVL